VHRATSAYSTSTDEGYDEASHRDQSIQNALIQVPSHRFLAVVEDACSYLIGSLEEICDDSFSAGNFCYTFDILVSIKF
jgi:hypothetical protein